MKWKEIKTYEHLYTVFLSFRIACMGMVWKNGRIELWKIIVKVIITIIIIIIIVKIPFGEKWQKFCVSNYINFMFVCAFPVSWSALFPPFLPFVPFESHRKWWKTYNGFEFSSYYTTILRILVFYLSYSIKCLVTCVLFNAIVSIRYSSLYLDYYNACYTNTRFSLIYFCSIIYVIQFSFLFSLCV